MAPPMLRLFSMNIFQNTLKCLAASAILAANSVFGGAVVAGFTTTALPANDDNSTGFVDFGLGSLNFFGVNYSGAYLNNNGNMTFGGPLSTFTPSAITAGSTPMLASFFADVDTRGSGSGLMAYGAGAFDGHDAFGQTWSSVGYYNTQTNLLNTFQTLLVKRDDVAAGDFDIYFNYDSIQWNTGSASGGSGGFGGTPARAGFTNGAGSYYELTGSGIDGAFVNGGSNALNANSLNSGVAGRYLFQVRNGTISVPDASSVLLMLGLALAGLGAVKRKLG